eukprot:scaffold73022_cov26-Tisochrysis_lutea.AAC.1
MSNRIISPAVFAHPDVIVRDQMLTFSMWGLPRGGEERGESVLERRGREIAREGERKQGKERGKERWGEQGGTGRRERREGESRRERSFAGQGQDGAAAWSEGRGRDAER